MNRRKCYKTKKHLEDTQEENKKEYTVEELYKLGRELNKIELAQPLFEKKSDVKE